MASALMLGLLWTGVAIQLLSVAGLFVLRNDWDRLHALGPLATLGSACLCGALGLAQGAALTAAKPLLLLVVVGTVGPLLTHAIARSLYQHQVARTGRRPEAKEGAR